MADYGYFENPKAAAFNPKPKPTPSYAEEQLIHSLQTQVQDLKAQLEELQEKEAVRSLSALAAELESGPVVVQNGEITRTLTNFTIKIRKHTFQVELQPVSAYSRDKLWQVTCSYGGHRFTTTDPDVLDSECEAAADLFDRLIALAEEETRLKKEFDNTRRIGPVSWEPLGW